MAKTHGSAKRYCNHSCSQNKNPINHKSINSMGYTNDNIVDIMDFYVFHAICKTCENQRKVSDYGWRGSTSKTEGYPALLEKLLECAEIHNSEQDINFAVIYGEKMEKTLFEMGFTDENKKLCDTICTAHPRIILLGEYSLSYDEDNQDTVKIIDKEQDVLCLFRHMRNAFAHSLTYEFSDKILLVDKNNKGGGITACILIKKQTLLDWINIVDKNHKFYSIKIKKN